MDEKNLNEICDNLFEFVSLFFHKFGNVFRKKNGIYKCKKNQNRAIMIIGRHGKITPTNLGKYLDMCKGSLTTLIDSLEKMNLITRKIDEKDRRKTWLYLTDKGKKYTEKKKNEFRQNILKLFDSLDEKEIEEFVKNIKTIVKIMKKI